MISTKGGILVGDDEAESLRLISSILTSAGYTVRAADNGGLALSAVVADPVVYAGQEITESEGIHLVPPAEEMVGR
jgi:CheY-like chemotaxis protein